MEIYVLRSAEYDLVQDAGNDDLFEDLLNTGALYATLEGAQAAALEDWTGYFGDEPAPALEWEQVEGTDGREWRAGSDAMAYSIRLQPVL